MILILIKIIILTMTIATEAPERNDSEYNIVIIKIITDIYKFIIKGIKLYLFKKATV